MGDVPVKNMSQSGTLFNQPDALDERAFDTPSDGKDAAMPWITLYAAIAFEVAGTTALKLSHGLQRPVFFIACLGLYLASFALLALTLRTVPVGTAYAIWSGLGTAAIAALGYLVFREPMGALKLVCLALIIAGCVGLNLAGETH